MQDLRAFVRAQGTTFLEDANVTSIGIGFKDDGGVPTDQLCVQFTVREKADGVALEALDTEPIPETVRVGDFDVPTDVIQRDYEASYELLAAEEKSDRKRRRAVLTPGISVSHPAGTAGTLGGIVFDAKDGAACMLSNWHVLHTGKGEIGDQVVQPGPYDDNRTEVNGAGTLVRSHLGVAGDCAIARIEERGIDPSVLDLDAPIARLARAELGDRVVKSGRTTGVTFGIVRRVDTMVKIRYGGVGEEIIGGFEIGPDPDHPAAENEISRGGDSGAAWLVSDGAGSATDIMVGLHFAGESTGNPDEHALACYAHAVFEKLEISLTPPAEPHGSDAAEYQPVGYDPEFLARRIRAPKLHGAAATDAYMLDGSPLIHYTHFSVCLSKSRRLAHFVAWNIDGGYMRRLSRKGIRFTHDGRVDRDCQVGNEAYIHNKLDRGHIARRADLCWGPLPEAHQANVDSFYWTNIVPQHEAFNQSHKHGLWGRLENAIFDDVDIQDLRTSVMAGPILTDQDIEYRGITVPGAYWKVIAYVDEQDGELKTAAYILTQDDLLYDIEGIDLDPFRLWQVSLMDLESRVPVRFGDLKEDDTFAPEQLPEAFDVSGPVPEVREITSRADL